MTDKISKQALADTAHKERNAWAGETLRQEHIDEMAKGQTGTSDYFAPVIWPVQSKDILPDSNGGCNFQENVALFTDSKEATYYAYKVPKMAAQVAALSLLLKDAVEALEEIRDRHVPNVNQYSGLFDDDVADEIENISNTAEKALSRIKEVQGE